MSLTQHLANFDLDEKEQLIYLLLLKYEWVTILQLAKLTDIKRATIYRLVDHLIELGLVQSKIDDKRSFYKAASIENFQSLIAQQQQKIKNMQVSFNQIKVQLPLLNLISASQTSVSFFRGVKGISAIEWKIANQKNCELLIFGVDKWWQIVGFEFAEEIRQKETEHNIMVREILNINKHRDEKWTNNQAFSQHHYQARYISKDFLPIENECLIVKDYIYLYSINDDEVVGIEICNRGYAQMMRGLFELSWQQAKE